jgi:hypothetical protein
MEKLKRIIKIYVEKFNLLRLNFYIRIFNNYYVKKLNKFIFNKFNFIWRINLVLIFIISLFFKLVIIKEILLLLLIGYLIIYIIEKNYFKYSNISIEMYIIYSLIIINILIILLFFFWYIIKNNFLIKNYLIIDYRFFIYFIIFCFLPLLFFKKIEKKNEFETKYLKRAELLLSKRSKIINWWENKWGRKWIIDSLLIIYLFVLIDHFILKRNLIILPIIFSFSLFIYVFIVFIIFILYCIYSFYYYFIIWERNKKYWKK